MSSHIEVSYAMPGPLSRLVAHDHQLALFAHAARRPVSCCHAATTSTGHPPNVETGITYAATFSASQRSMTLLIVLAYQRMPPRAGLAPDAISAAAI